MLTQGNDVVALAEAAAVEIEVPMPPSIADAKAAESRFDKGAHIYPGCFVCGPDRAERDGWRIFAGSIGGGRVAASFTPDAEFGDAGGDLKPEFVWAALDCPGYFAVQQAAGLALLGRMAVVIHRRVPTGEPLIVQAWDRGSEGRKHCAGTALHLSDGTLLAAAEQIWVTVKDA